MCDICNWWEDVGCVRQADRPSEALYDALIECHTKSLMYVCSRRREGPVPKQLLKLELERVCADDEQLASVRQLEQSEATIRELCSEIKELVAKQAMLQGELLQLTKQLLEIKVKCEPLLSDVQEENASEQQSSEEHELSGSESVGSSNNSRQSRPRQRETRRVDPCPPGSMLWSTE